MTPKGKLADNSQGSAKRKRPRKPITGRGRGPGRPFPPGVSGNPGGRPKSVKEVQELASTYTVEAVQALVTTMRRCQGIVTEDGISVAADWKEVRQAAVALLNRACGMPSQPITGVPGAPLTLTAGEGLVAVLAALAGEPEPKAK
jgi:hypothetical protein